MILFKSKKRKRLENFGLYIIKTSKVIFIVSVITFIVYFSLEQFKTGVVSNYFDLNILLVLAIITGILVLLFAEDAGSVKRRNRPNYVFLAIFAILLGVFIFQQTSSLGPYSLFIALVCILALYSIFSVNLNKYD